jgi:hypothetical protein
MMDIINPPAWESRVSHNLPDGSMCGNNGGVAISKKHFCLPTALLQNAFQALDAKLWLLDIVHANSVKLNLDRYSCSLMRSRFYDV